jgi:dTDP-4-dehydrorhamnose 3,5-epimerase
MFLNELAIPGLFALEFEWIEDERGSYGRGWRKHEFESRGLSIDFYQTNVSRTLSKGTIRGLHWQVAPHQESKLLICTNGVICHATIDMRQESRTYMRAVTVLLSAAAHQAIYVPDRCAQGFLTLEDNSDILYSSTARYNASSERGVRYNDPAFCIKWPIEIKTVSPKDSSWADFDAT